MTINTFITEEMNDTKNIFHRIKTHNFSGTTGQAIKNSSYQLAQSLIFKFGSLFFTIILARMLLPDRMGLYNLALATIVLFASFSDLGISAALITYGAKILNKNNPRKAKGYLKKLFKWKLYLTLFASGILLISANFIANYYYQKPIFYALLMGGLYLAIVSIISFLEQIFKTTENFKTPMIKEIIFQISRLIIVPLILILILSSNLSDQKIVFITLIALIISYSIPLLFLITKTKKIKFLKEKSEDLNQKEIKDLKQFIYPLSATAMAGLFFGYIDTLMLGHYVSTEFIAYYGAAFSLIGGFTMIIGFAATAIMPILARKSGKALESIFRKTRNITLIISVLSGIIIYILSPIIIKLIYGIEYLPAVGILQWFSILIILIPTMGIYVSYFTTQNKTKQLAWLILFSSILNIIFNYFGITFGLNYYGEMGAVLGAVGATILSRVVYLGGLIIWRK